MVAPSSSLFVSFFHAHWNHWDLILLTTGGRTFQEMRNQRENLEDIGDHVCIAAFPLFSFQNRRRFHSCFSYWFMTSLNFISARWHEANRTNCESKHQAASWKDFHEENFSLGNYSNAADSQYSDNPHSNRKSWETISSKQVNFIKPDALWSAIFINAFALHLHISKIFHMLYCIATTFTKIGLLMSSYLLAFYLLHFPTCSATVSFCSKWPVEFVLHCRIIEWELFLVCGFTTDRHTNW